ncbi:unnamed protein product [Mucor hiemalis]
MALKRESMQTAKVALILCSCFFAYGLYYANQAHIPSILKYIPIANLCIATAGFATGLVSMTDGNFLFDGASLVLTLFGISTYITSVKPAIIVVSESKDQNDITTALKNIAAAHFIIVLAITGIIGLQIAHYFIMKRSNKEDEEDIEEEDEEGEEEEEEEDKKTQ